MNLIRRVSVFAIVGVALVGLVAAKDASSKSVGVSLVGVVAARGFSSKPICQVAAEWVSAHPNVRPASLSAFSKYDPPYRREIFKRLSEHERNALWHEQLRYYAASEALTAAQRAFLSETDLQLEQLMAQRPQPRRKALEAVKLRGVAILGLPLARAVLADLGGAPATEPEMKANTKFYACTCSRADSWCGGGGATALFPAAPGMELFGVVVHCGVKHAMARVRNVAVRGYAVLESVF